jgi:hypothetical protein
VQPVLKRRILPQREAGLGNVYGSEGNGMSLWLKTGVMIITLQEAGQRTIQVPLEAIPIICDLIVHNLDI